MSQPPTAQAGEREFAAEVNAATTDPTRHHELADLLCEEHPAYAGRGAAAVVRMRGWVLLALARVGLTDATLAFALEELATGHDPYLVAAAARALRSYSQPDPGLVPFVLSGIDNVRDRDEAVSFVEYGGYEAMADPTSPLSELLAALAWLGPHAAGELARIEALGAPGSGLATGHRAAAVRVAALLRDTVATGLPSADCCSPPPPVRTLTVWERSRRRESKAVEEVSFEDQDGSPIGFREFFHGRLSVVVFFYTRCDNPRKCSLTVTKLARLQAILAGRGLAEQVQTAAITYDPEHDRPERLRRYGLNRGVRLAEGHRLLRTVSGFAALCHYFRLGVNFSGSLVNRHRLEVFILDSRGRVAATFERLHWSEEAVADRAAAVLREGHRPGWLGWMATVFGTVASVGLACFPKCPVCWATYLSVFGLTSLQSLLCAPWLRPALAAAMVVNLTSIAARARTTRRYWPLGLAAAGAIALLGLKVGLGWDEAALPGALLMLAGSVASVVRIPKRNGVL